MKKGPLLNNNKKNFTTRDSLGIEGVAASISAELCPIVNTVTPRAFYWPFMVWIYYDFYKYSGIEEHNYSVFDKEYVKRQDYFFVLSQLLNDAPDQYNLVGKQNTMNDLLNNPDGPYEYNPNYFVSTFGGMQYYNAGCISLDYVREIDVDNNGRFSFPKLTPDGKKMALAFQNVIKDTEYYKKYRLNNVPVPKSVLIEYGQVINIGLKGFDKCKIDLKNHLFNNEHFPVLTDCCNYIKHIYNEYDMQDSILASFREILFDAYSIRGRNESIGSELRSVSNGWEIVIGRQYFTSGLESIWKFMLYNLNLPMTKKEWISLCINRTNWTLDLDTCIKDVLDECNYDYNTRESMIYDASHLRNVSCMVENGMKIILSMYNRFVDRTDFGDESAYLTWGNESSSISFEELITTVNNYKNRTIRELLTYIMDQWLIEQHYKTAFEKLLQNRDGFYYEIIDGRYIHKCDFDMAFQGIRLFQLAQVMKDLDIL